MKIKLIQPNSYGRLEFSIEELEELLKETYDEDFYKEDYRETTVKLISDSLEYEILKNHYQELVKNIFR